ncbi:hypothetical protein ACK3SF_00450 [Candidatus Nanosalina sp. VS9-1]|uniref:hypothetical protein n=1 Tax=Candidatus Nanosalina sp. VS9-1 TaxID=3388566 RepID=UPI0039E0ACBC
MISTGAGLNRRELRETAVDHVLDNMDQYDDPVDYEALGLALYTEDVITGARDDLDSSEITDYLAENNVDDQRFIGYKASLASDYDEFVGFMEDFIGMRDELVDDIESEGVFYQALYEEAKNERNNAEQALNDIIGLVSDARAESSWLDNIPERGPEQDDPETDNPEPERPGSGPGTPGEDSDNFSTWSNYNFGEQVISGGLNTWSNYNFGTQVAGFEGVEVIEGELNEDILEEDFPLFEEQEQSSESWIYNPQIRVSPTINITAGGESWSFDQAS